VPVGYKFEWDRRKGEANRKKHGVVFEEAITVFGDPLSINMPDPDHSHSEHRYIVMGLSDRYRLLVVCYTEKEDKTRIISARLATRAERKTYEEK
jgi:uncharacterized DUF497 family protein